MKPPAAILDGPTKVYFGVGRIIMSKRLFIINSFVVFLPMLLRTFAAV
jgi:hypothetical protein